LYEPGDGKKLLFAGDANITSLQMMLENHPETKNVDLLKVPHHGSRRNLNTSIIEDLAPQKCYISAAGNKKHPSGQLVYWLAKYGDVYSTHKCNSYIHCQYGNMPQRRNTISVEPLKRKT
jgi:beta-lactamase superfamily II metal-dependent hydrolase